MNCNELERELEELEEYSNFSPAIESHLRLCSTCSELVEDLKYIRRQALQLSPVEQPPEWVWQGIRRRLEKDGVIAEAVGRRFFSPSSALGWFSRLGMGFAYAAVFLVALGVVYVYSILSPRIPDPPAIAIAPPNPPFAQLLEQVPPEKRDTYVTNLNQVESSIQQLNTFLAAHPEDPFARQALFDTYQQKSRLWEAMVRSQEF